MAKATKAPAKKEKTPAKKTTTEKTAKKEVAQKKAIEKEPTQKPAAVEKVVAVKPKPVTDLPRAVVEERSARRLRAGYPWLFRSELVQKPAAEDGEVVDIVTKTGEFVARGYYNSMPQLSIRVMTRNPAISIDEDYVFDAIEKAIEWRDSLYDGQPYYRLVHAESDGLPGLIVDRYGDVLVAQVNTAGMNRLYPAVQEALVKLLKPKAIVLRNDSNTREQEGLPRESSIAYGKLKDNKVAIVENGVTFMTDVVEGQKTGWFFDQRDNRLALAKLSKGKTFIDVFCHTGGFGMTALKNGAKSCLFLDTSAKALADTKENAAENGFAKKCEYIEGRAFDEIEKLNVAGLKYEVVSVDPPAFIKSRKDMNAGMKGYNKLARISAKLVEKGGILFFASCSHHADVKELLDVVSDGIARTGRPFQLIRVSGAAADHPVHPALPETGYLKGFTFRFLD